MNEQKPMPGLESPYSDERDTLRALRSINNSLAARVE